MGSVGLHVCAWCDSRLVQLLASTPVEGVQLRWRLWRRCPECGWWDDGVYGRGECRAFNKVLAEGSSSLRWAAETLERESMGDFVKVFVAALDAGVVGADDFRAR
jgi:hypothetical protein